MDIIWQFFFSTAPNQLIGTAVNVAILVLGIWGLVELVRASAALRRDAEALAGFDQQVRHRTSAAQVFDLARNLPARHLLSRRIQVLHDLHTAGADIETSTLAALAVAELDREARFARWASGTVVLLGLAGTLLGLSQAVIRAQPMLGDIVSGPQAVQAVMGTFSGLGTAFSTTLMGILWAVLLGIFLGRFRASQGRYLQHLEEMSLVRIFPHFRTSPALAMVEAAKKLTALEEKLGTALGEIVSQVKTQGLALTKTVEDSISDLTVDARTTGQALRGTVEIAMTQLVRETQERGVALATTVDRSFTNLTEELRTGTAGLLSQFEVTHLAMARLLGDPGADARSLADNLRALQTGIEAISLAANRMNQMAPALEEVMARQLDRQSRDQHEALHAYAGRLSTAVERQDAVQEEGFRRLERGIGGFGEVLLTQLQAHDTELLQQVGVRTGEVAAAVQAQAAHLEELRQATGRLTEATQHLESRGAEEREAARQIREATNLLTAQLDDLGGRMERLRTGFEAVAARVPPSMPSTTAYGATPPHGQDGRDGAGRLSPTPAPPSSPATAPVAPPTSGPLPRIPEPRPPVSPPRPEKKPGIFSWIFGRD